MLVDKNMACNNTLYRYYIVICEDHAYIVHNIVLNIETLFWFWVWNTINLFISETVVSL